MIVFMQDSGIIKKDTERENVCGLMVAFIKVIFLMEKPIELED